MELVKISHLFEILNEIVIVLTSYANCNEAKRKFGKLYVYMSKFLN